MDNRFGQNAIWVFTEKDHRLPPSVSRTLFRSVAKRFAYLTILAKCLKRKLISFLDTRTTENFEFDQSLSLGR